MCNMNKQYLDRKSYRRKKNKLKKGILIYDVVSMHLRRQIKQHDQRYTCMYHGVTIKASRKRILDIN